MTLLVLLRDRHIRACRDSKGRNCREGSGKLQALSYKLTLFSLQLEACHFREASAFLTLR